MQDTEQVYSKVSTEILARYGKIYDWPLKAQLMGMREMQVHYLMQAAEFLVKTVALPITPQEYLIERNAKQVTLLTQNRLFPECKILPGVERLVTHLKQQGVPIAVCTSSHRKAYDLKTSKHTTFFSLFDAVICGDDPAGTTNNLVVNGKPAPDIFIQGLAALGFTDGFERVLVFEDAPAGVRAGLAAGMQVVWIPDPNLHVDSAIGDQCAQILNSMEEFIPHEYGLSPYQT